LFTRLRNEKLQFAGLVTAEGKPSLVVALDQDGRSAQLLRKAREFLDGSWEVGEMEAGIIVHKSSFFQSYSVVE
jgi:hypothetical protein